MMEALIAQLKAADASSLDLDVAVSLAIGTLFRDENGKLFRLDPDDGARIYAGCDNTRVITRRLTSSMDDLVSAAEAKLPGIWWMIAKGRLTATVPLCAVILLFGEDEVGTGEHDKPCLAGCIALLRALTEPIAGHQGNA